MRRSNPLCDFDAGFAHLGEGSLGGLRGHAGAEVEEEAGGEAVGHCIECRGSDAVVGGESADVDSFDVALAQPVGERGAVVVPALEAGVRRLVLALEEDRVERPRLEVRVPLLAGGADLAVDRPRVDVVGLGRPVPAGVDVVIPGGHDVGVAGGAVGAVDPGPQQTADLGLIFDPAFKGPGLKIAEILRGGPADRRGLALNVGDIVLAIDREELNERVDPATLLNDRVNEVVSLTVTSNSAGVVYTTGGGPDAGQRSLGTTIYRDNPHIALCAIVTPSEVVRAIVTALLISLRLFSVVLPALSRAVLRVHRDALAWTRAGKVGPWLTLFTPNPAA